MQGMVQIELQQRSNVRIAMCAPTQLFMVMQISTTNKNNIVED